MKGENKMNNIEVPLKIYNHQHYTVDKDSCGLDLIYKPKIAYDTKESAEKFMSRFSDKRLNVYQCVVCNKWHIGRKKGV